MGYILELLINVISQFMVEGVYRVVGWLGCLIILFAIVAFGGLIIWAAS